MQLRQPVGILLAKRGVPGQHLEALAGMFGAGGQLLEVGEDVGLDRVLQLVGELVAVGAEDLDAVVPPGIVRGRNHDARRHAVGAREIRDARRGDDAGADHLHLRAAKSSRQHGADPCARLARVLANDHACAGVALGQTLAKRASNGVDRSPVQRILAGDASNSIGSE